MLETLVGSLQEYLPEHFFWIVGVSSLLMFVGTLAAIPFLMVRLPTDYFDERVPRTWMKDHHPILRIVGQVVKNLVGGVFLLAGIAMLVLPGQGILTMLIGLSLLDFPGKRYLEGKIVSQPAVFHAVNAMREKFGREPFTLAPKPGCSPPPPIEKRMSKSIE